jgi:hypothetical protein
MKPITREELDRWKELAEAATEGPWEVIERGGYYYFKPPGDHRMGRKRKENAEFIAAARDAVPRLVAEVERLNTLYQPCEENRNHNWLWTCPDSGDLVFHPAPSGTLVSCTICGRTTEAP